jgi:hypothetical protein
VKNKESIMQTITIEIEDNYRYELLNLLKKLPIKIIENQPKTLKKKYTKQEMLNKISYQGTPSDSQNIDALIYL